jgi:phosphate-selective porin OprO/OprP
MNRSIESSLLVRTLLALLVLSAGIAKAQIVDPQNVLIRNVHLVEGGEATKDVLVSVLIKDNKLEIVTKDPVPLEEGGTAVDARGGYLFGQLKIGDTPSFIILDQDPRDDFNVLLNTSRYTIFAVHNGQLFRNNLYAARDDESAPAPAQSAWRSYTPPPLALPLSYQDTTKWNRWETKYVDGIFVAGVVLDRQSWRSQDSDSEFQVGNLDLFDGGEIRGFRLGAVGTLNFKKPWVYTLFGATNAFDKGFELEQQEDFTMFDYRLDIPVFKNVNLSVGNQKEPISMERVMSLAQLPLQERTSVSDAFLPSRNFGMVMSGTALNQRMTWAGGVFNNWLNSRGSIGDNPTATVGRVTWLPWVSEDESNLLHLGLGVRHSTVDLGVQASTEPEFNKSPIYVDTGLIDANDSLAINLEASWRKGPFWVAAEYIDSAVDSPTFGDLDFSGYHVSGSWVLTGEMRSYNKKSGIVGPIPISKTVYQGGKGAWELGARWSSIDLTDGLVDGGEMDILSLGVNWWLTPVFNVNMNYRFITLDRLGVEGDSSGFAMRVLLMME